MKINKHGKQKKNKEMYWFKNDQVWRHECLMPI